ncbi:RusA family crossover junction endodeoxyribonuclease [Pseudomonas oryzihabitans]|uniref:RusA family crossover junction endodeoxyribonuclease n=1 Tax=Pseudomonas oryzihabitans TaxID=47885 RepID=UPI002B1E23A3|nr:RusA family crossover junction endodeoxyribonuclease [Pseudomonas oryzihabitans]
MQTFEFMISKRPVSLQTKNRKNLQAWKSFVRGEAAKLWVKGAPPVSLSSIRFTIVYLCEESPADIDNIIKPIQDALVGLVFKDDFLVSDVDSHRRFLDEPIDVTCLPPLLQSGVAAGNECVYVRVSDAQELRSYL